MAATSTPAKSAATIALTTLMAGQFLMMLDSSVMNVSIATVAKDVGTTVTGVQTAITLYMLVMAAFMITGGKIGQIIGRKKAFAIGCVVYGAGSGMTSLSQTLPQLIFGWSFLEGLGAALILPAIVALVASNFAQAERPKAYGLVAAAGAVAIATGPIIGGLCTTYASWRLVFAGEVIVVLGILAFTRRMADGAKEPGVKIDGIGVVLSATALSLIVFAILKAGEWGFVKPKVEAPVLFGLSPTIWLVFAGGAVGWVFFAWEFRRIAKKKEPLVDPAILKVPVLQGGLTAFFFQYLLQAGMFFALPLFLSVALGLSAIDTGVRVLPLSIALLLAAAGVPKMFPNASPRRVVRIGFALLFLGLVVFVALLDVNASASITTWPMILAGLGIGALSSQLGAVTVSSVPDEKSSEVGGLQNTFTNLGAAIGTALAGAIIVSALTSSLIVGIQTNAQIPDSVKDQASVKLAKGVPFVSDADLESALSSAGVPQATADAIVEENESARIDGLRTSLSVLALIVLVASVFTGKIPSKQPQEEQVVIDISDHQPTNLRQGV